ncbi:PGAP1-like protein [Aureococcus anophagefferens]|nr:PGAP1-like protein [Aureococcus anophagefferens]
MMGSEAKMEEQALLSDADRAAEVASLKAAEAANLATAKALYEQQKMEGDEKEARGRAESAELLDPFALGTVAMLVGAFVDNVCSALYDVPLKYYLYDDLGVSASASYCGAFVGQALASVLYENELGLGSWGGFTISQIFVICGVAPFVVVIPLACFLKEVPSIAARSTKSVAARARFEFVAIWETLQDKRIGCILSFGLALYL